MTGSGRRPAPGGLHVAVDGSGLARPRAGVATYTRELLRAMAGARPGSRLTVYGPHDPGLRGSGLEARAASRTPLAGRHLAWPLRLRRLGADVYFGPAGAVPLGGAGAPTVVTAHDLAIYRHPEWFPAGQWLSVRLVVPRSLRRAAAVVAVSESTARDVADIFGVEAGRLHVVPEGVSTAFRPLAAESVAEVGRRHRLPERFVLFVSTLEPRKNLGTLLDAWARMRDRPGLVVAGAWGWRQEDLRRRLEGAPPGLRLLGPVEPAELPALYNLATCLAHPAWYEGFGLTPLEAMACGLPAVVSDASSLPELAGGAGLLVNPGDVEGWTAALERACGDEALRAGLRERGLQRAAELTWPLAAERTWGVLERAAG